MKSIKVNAKISEVYVLPTALLTPWARTIIDVIEPQPYNGMNIFYERSFRDNFMDRFDGVYFSSLQAYFQPLKEIGVGKTEIFSRKYSNIFQKINSEEPNRYHAPNCSVGEFVKSIDARFKVEELFGEVDWLNKEMSKKLNRKVFNLDVRIPFRLAPGASYCASRFSYSTMKLVERDSEEAANVWKNKV